MNRTQEDWTSRGDLSGAEPISVREMPNPKPEYRKTKEILMPKTEARATASEPLLQPEIPAPTLLIVRMFFSTESR